MVFDFRKRSSISSWLAMLVMTGTAAASETLLVRNVQLMDFSGPTPSITRSAWVLIEGDRIAATGQEGRAPGQVPEREIDGGGRFLMPGLVDMHVHLWDEAELGAYLARGVTTIRNASGMPFHLALQDRIAAGELTGPRLVTTGPILNSPGPNQQVNHQLVETAEEARAAVRQQYAAGYRRLKVYSNLTRASYEAIRDEAAVLGMTVMGHSPEGAREPGMPRDRPFDIAFEELLDDGFVTFEHVETIVWHALRDRLDEAAARILARRMAAAGAVVDPTLLAFYNLMRTAETRGAYLQREGVELLNPLIVGHEAENYERWSTEDAEDARRRFDFYKRVTRILREAGVRLVAGSDAGIFTNIPGASLLTELQLLVDAGLSPHEVLQAATYNAAWALDEADEAGRVAPGYRADLLLLDEDPLADVTAAGRPAAMILNGRYLSGAELARLLTGARPSYERTERNVTAGLEAQAVQPGRSH
jgi:imidazolonepropionase-like amidohydrolase